MTDKTIKIEIRNVYGRNAAYPACDNAEAFAQIAGSKTLTPTTIVRIIRLGYVIIEVNRFGGEVRTYRPAMVDDRQALVARVA